MNLITSYVRENYKAPPPLKTLCRSACKYLKAETHSPAQLLISVRISHKLYRYRTVNSPTAFFWFPPTVSLWLITMSCPLAKDENMSGWCASDHVNLTPRPLETEEVRWRFCDYFSKINVCSSLHCHQFSSGQSHDQMGCRRDVMDDSVEIPPSLFCGRPLSTVLAWVGALEDGFGEAAMAELEDMPQPWEFLSLDSNQKRILWAHK